MSPIFMDPFWPFNASVTCKNSFGSSASSFSSGPIVAVPNNSAESGISPSVKLVSNEAKTSAAVSVTNAASGAVLPKTII